MDIGIVGLPRSGKTTIFNAVTRGMAQAATHTGPQGKPNMGVAKVPDSRLDVLGDIFEPKRKTPAEVTYVDVPAASEGFETTRGISGQILNYLQRTDALLVVARAFEDPSVEAFEDTVDPSRDVETMAHELAFADLEILERRLARVAREFKGAKAPERESLNKEQDLLTRLKRDLETGIPIRDQRIGQDEVRRLEDFQFLTAKPLIVAVNIGESQLSDLPSLEDRLPSGFVGPRVRLATLCGKLEMELAQMEAAEEREFREALGLGESGLDLMIALSHDVLDLITFFTGNSNEVRTWTIARGSTVVEAAGRIHSDFERGFIRAEVVRFDDLVHSGSIAETRRRGVLRQEGKTYVVNDGDVINVLFNV